jgi:hypothetical protein
VRPTSPRRSVGVKPARPRWRHVAGITVHAFVASFAATASVSTVLVFILTRSPFVTEIVLVGCLGLSAILAALTAFGAYRLHLESERRSFGQCLRCGYDLRESTYRCPECGAWFARPRPREDSAEKLPRRQTWV